MSTIIDFQSAAKKLQPDYMPDNPLLRSLVPLWLAARRADNHSQRGIASYRNIFNRFIHFAGEDTRIKDVDADLIKRYKHDRMTTVGAGTTLHALTVIRAFFAWAMEEKYLRESPAATVSNPKVHPPDPDPLSREEIDQLLAVIDKPPRSHKATWRRNRRAVLLMLYAGLRLAEAAGLEWRDIDLRRRTITVRRDVAKGGKPRVLPICDELLEELQAASGYEPTWAVVDQGNGKGAGKPLTVQSMVHIFDRWLVGRGLKIHAHQLRKTFATELYLRGEDITTIQRLLGHSDPKTTAGRYIGASSQKEAKAVQKLTFRKEQKS